MFIETAHIEPFFLSYVGEESLFRVEAPIYFKLQLIYLKNRRYMRSFRRYNGAEDKIAMEFHIRLVEFQMLHRQI